MLKHSIKINIYPIFITLFVISTIGLCSCKKNDNVNTVGHGTSGVVEKLDWSKYDDLLKQITTITDLDKRESLMHEAEDMLMYSGAVLPLYYGNRYCLVDTNVKNFHLFPLNGPDATYAYIDGKDTLNSYLFAEPNNLAINLGSTANLMMLNKFITSPLVRQYGDGKIKPFAAKELFISDDKLTYTFIMRDDLRWSDGSKLDARDFEYGFRWGCDPKNAAEYSFFFSYIEGYPDNLNITSSPNGKILTIKLKAPCSYFLDMLIYPIFMPLKKDEIEKYDSNDPTAWGQDVNHSYSGPYIVSEWKRKEYMVLKKNPYFFDKDNLKTDTMNFMLSTDANTILNAFDNRDISISSSVSNNTIKKYKGKPELITVEDIAIYFLRFNVKADIFKGMTSDEACTFRKAISYAIDREFIANVPLDNNQKAANTLIPKNTLNGKGKLFCQNTDKYTYPCKEELGYFPIKRDINKAREMLKSIGFEFGENGKLKTPFIIETLVSSTSAAGDPIVECIQQDLLDLGIRFKPVSTDSMQFFAEVDQGHYQTAASGWMFDYNDPYSLLEIFGSNNPNNSCQLGR